MKSNTLFSLMALVFCLQANAWNPFGGSDEEEMGPALCKEYKLSVSGCQCSTSELGDLLQTHPFSYESFHCAEENINGNACPTAAVIPGTPDEQPRIVQLCTELCRKEHSEFPHAFGRPAQKTCVATGKDCKPGQCSDESSGGRPGSELERE